MIKEVKEILNEILETDPDAIVVAFRRGNTMNVRFHSQAGVGDIIVLNHTIKRSIEKELDRLERSPLSCINGVLHEQKTPTGPEEN